MRINQGPLYEFSSLVCIGKVRIDSPMLRTTDSRLRQDCRTGGFIERKGAMRGYSYPTKKRTFNFQAQLIFMINRIRSRVYLLLFVLMTASSTGLQAQTKAGKATLNGLLRNFGAVVEMEDFSDLQYMVSSGQNPVIVPGKDSLFSINSVSSLS